MFPDSVPTEALDFKTLANCELSGGNIRSAALSAAFIAAGKQCPVNMADIETAIGYENVKLGKVLTV